MTHRELKELLTRLGRERRDEAMRILLASKVEQQRN